MRRMGRRCRPIGLSNSLGGARDRQRRVDLFLAGLIAEGVRRSSSCMVLATTVVTP